MRKLFATAAAGFAGILAYGAAPAVAAPILATSVIEANVGSGPRLPGRSIEARSLGEADGKFYSLGKGGDLTLGFGGTISGTTQIGVREITYNDVASYGEAVDVFALFGEASTLVGRLTNLEAANGVTLSYNGMFDALRFVDVSKKAFGGTPSKDGFDIDAVELTNVSLAAVPVPLSAGFLLTGLAAFGLARRRS